MSGSSGKTHVDIDGDRFTLHSDCDTSDVKAYIELAARTEPTFVHLPGEHSLVRVLISRTSRVVFIVEPESVAQPDAFAPFGPSSEWGY